MNSIINYRQLGQGIKNKDNKEIKGIFRSGNLNCSLDSTIKTVYDLRTSSEQKKDGIFKSEFYDIKHYSLLTFSSQNDISKINVEVLKDVFTKIYSKELIHSKEIAPLFKDIISNKSPFLFHCSAGKDRTGVVGIIIMYILNFDIEDIENEYLLYDQRLKDYIAMTFEKLNIVVDDVELFIVTKHYFESYINAIILEFGTIDNYIIEFLKINEKQLNEFRSTYLTDIC